MAPEGEMHSREGDGRVDTAYLVLNRVLLFLLVERLMEGNLLVSPLCVLDSIH